MARQLNPDHVAKLGRQLYGITTYTEATEATLRSESLFALMHNGMFPLCPEIANQTEYDYYRNQYDAGLITSMTFYAVPNSKIP